MFDDPIARQNGTPPVAITIMLEPGPGGRQNVRIVHHLEGGWTATVQVLLQALALAHHEEVKELKGQQEPEKPPLILPVSYHPRFRPEVG